MTIMFELKEVTLLTAAHFHPSSSKFASYDAFFIVTRLQSWRVFSLILCLSSLISTYLFTSLSCHFALQGGSPKKNPPVAPYWTSFTGHLIPFLGDPANLSWCIA